MFGRRRGKAPESPGATAPAPERGPHLILERLDEQATEILIRLCGRYELEALGDGGRLFVVYVDEACFPHEAVVRVALQLDEIDSAWQRHIGWPRILSWKD